MKQIVLIWSLIGLFFLPSGCAAAEKKKFTNRLGMEFVFIPPGSFMMGSPEDEPDRRSNETLHRVELTKGFYMQTSELTQRQWEDVMGFRASGFQECGDDCPVEEVSWDQVQEFIQTLNKLEGGEIYRLPTEAEWEYACRAGAQTRFNWGPDADCAKANYGNGQLSNECKDVSPGKTVAVKSYAPNAWGLYDMHGNVSEWCQDGYLSYSEASVADQVGPISGCRINRGGSWLDRTRTARSAARACQPADFRSRRLGFRLVKMP